MAKLLTISTKYPLSTQLTRLTGDSWNVIDFEQMNNREVIKHKKSGAFFIIYSFHELENLKELDLLNQTLDYFKKEYGFKKVETVNPNVLFPDALAGVKIAKTKKPA